MDNMKPKKIKTYVIPVSRFFPSTHPRKGEETDFIDAIKDGRKIHTIRGNYELWAKRIAQVQAGEAILSLRYWEGRPRFSEQVEFLRLDKDRGVCVQELKFNEGFVNEPMIWDGNCWVSHHALDIAKKDGLYYDNYLNWFRTGGYDLSKTMAIIHFTPFRY